MKKPRQKTDHRTASRFDSFYRKNPDFELLTFDFHDPVRRASLTAAPKMQETLEALKVRQRILRLLPRTDPSVGLTETDAQGTADALIARGLVSAHHVAAMPEHEFVREYAGTAGGNEELARTIHRRAVQMKAAVRHLWANVRDISSPSFRAGAANIVDPALIDYFENIPSFQAFFGGLQYYGCEHCRSIFGPAAYFLDLMRITDRYITDPSFGTIPAGFKLRDRRPDLFTMKLTCANTLDPVPTVLLVNDVIEHRLAPDGDLYQRLATERYPFELPFNLPLRSIELYLAQGGTSLAALAGSMRLGRPEMLGYGTPQLAGAALGISPEMAAELTTPNTSEATIGAQYGFASAGAHLPAPGPGTVAIEKDKRTADGSGGPLGKLLIAGQQFEAAAMVRTVTKVVSDTTVEVDVPWLETNGTANYSIFPLDDLSLAGTFRARAGDLAYDVLVSLFRQGLTDKEIAAGAADNLFINATGELLPPLAIRQNYGGDTDNPRAQIVNLTPARLDRLSRFLRLATALGTSYELTDWLLQSAGVAEITMPFLLFAGDLVQIEETTELAIEELAGFVHVLKTTGAATPFNLIFNNPMVLAGADPYTTPSPIAFDPVRPLAWIPGVGDDTISNSGSVNAATASTVTLAADASAADGAYDGLAIVIVSGKGAGETAIVRQYAGASRQATLYTDWKTVPDATSAYQVRQTPGLANRLAAALQIKKIDLDNFGAYLQGGQPGQPLLLTLANLTALWRLARLANRYNYTADEMLVLRRILGIGSQPPPAGKPSLEQLQALLDGIRWQQSSAFSVYEIDYVLTGLRSRYLRVAFDAQSVPSFINDLANAAAGTLVTKSTIAQLGFSEVEAQRLRSELETKGFLDGRGIWLLNQPAFDVASAEFPTTAASFAGDLITPAEAAAVVAGLTANHPPYLVAKGGGPERVLASAYLPAASLDFLFAGEAEAAGKRARVGAVLDAVAAQIAATELAGLFPIVAAETFVTDDIGVAQSEGVYTVLSRLTPPVVIAETLQKGRLSARYNASTPLPGLFESAAAGQSRLVTGYDGSTRTATVDAGWGTVPDAFSYYEIRRPANDGTATGGSDTTIRLAESASPEDGAYTGSTVALTSGSGAPEQRIISAYDGPARTATVATPWQNAPDGTTKYAVYGIVARGNARSGSAKTIVLADAASAEDAAYNGLSVALIPDPDRERKVGQVRTTIATVAAEIGSIASTLANARVQQSGQALQALAAFLGLSTERTLVLLPYAAGVYSLGAFLPLLLTPVPNEVAPIDAVALLGRFSRAALAATGLGLNDLLLRVVARRPEQYGVSDVEALTFADLRRLLELRLFAAALGDDGTRVSTYFDVWTAIAGEAGKRHALEVLTGWPAEQVRIVGAFLASAGIEWKGIDDFAGVARLVPPFAMMSELAADGNYLARMAGIPFLPPLGPDGGTADAALWTAYTSAAEATLTLLNARYHDADFAVIGNDLARSVDVAKRNAALGYAVWKIGQTVTAVRKPSDLFEYLLIDVEMSACDTTSRIAEGINAVQLYMQRARMGFEPGASTALIRDVWWSWISTYRLWEANRKIFLYPENYIDPNLRKGASPQFRELSNELLQSAPDDEHVARAMAKYFEAFEELASLVHVGGCKFANEEREGGQVDERAYLIARSNTTPYKYYIRTFARHQLLDTHEIDPKKSQKVLWEPWLPITATIDAPYVTPVFVFDRLFLVWNEIKATKSSKISGSPSATQSETQSTWMSTLKYTFRSATGEWVSAQELKKPTPTRVMPNDYPPAVEPLIATAYEPAETYWSLPLAQNIPRGLPAAGTLTFDAGSKTAKGTATALERQVKPGDQIWSGGDQRFVTAVDGEVQNLTVERAFTVSAKEAEFRVIPRDEQMNVFPPFAGSGGVATSDVLPQVVGDGTSFRRDFSVGDAIQVGDEMRTVAVISSDESLVVDRVWGSSLGVLGPGKIELQQNFTVVIGDDKTKFETLKPGDKLWALGQERKIMIVRPPQRELVVDTPFDISEPFVTTRYLVNGAGFTVIPRGNGAERLLISYGPNLDIQAVLPNPADNGHQPNPGDDPFIASKNEFNAALFDGLRLVRVVRNNLGPATIGDVTAQRSLVLADDLRQTSVRFFASGYDAAQAKTTPVTRTAIDSRNDLLYIEPESRPLLALYWGDQIPGSVFNQHPIVAADRPLVYHVDPAVAALVGFGNQLGWYLLATPRQSFLIAVDDPRVRMVAPSMFVRPFWTDPAPELRISFGPWTTSNIAFAGLRYRFMRLTTSVVQQLQQRLSAGGFDLLLSLDSQFLPEQPFDDYYQIPKGTPPPAVDPNFLPPDVMDFEGAYGLYFWEIFFHAPMLVAAQLGVNRDFARAKRWYEYIFDPNARGEDVPLPQRYWQFRPFRFGMTIPGLEEILTNPFEINAYNDDPFDPDAIARLRISAYAKATLLRYVNNLIEWGDALFAEDTRESIAQATNLYVLANNLLGARPEKVGDAPVHKPQSFDEIKAASNGDIPQFLIELENSRFVPVSGEGARFADVPVNDINAYFCVPENSELTAYWDRIDDRLYKIRHCMNLAGVERTLALFAPPIDPRTAIQAFGSSASGLAGAVFAPYPIPNQRFAYLVAQARGVAGDVLRLGASLLGALERRDTEALATLRLKQEAQLLNLTTAIRQQQIDSIVEQRKALDAGKGSALERQTHYKKLLDEGFLPTEEAEIGVIITAGVLSGISAIVKTAAAIAYAVPQVGSPFAMTYGGQQLGATLQATGGVLDVAADVLRTTGQVLAIYANQTRREEEWSLQQNLAAFDVASFDAQLLANTLQKQTAERELQVVVAQIAQNKAVEEFYARKFTNEELYQWMAGRVAAMYYQSYALALQLARMAQRAYQYQFRSNASFVSGSYWDDLHRGLTAGEGLLLSLSQMDAAGIHAASRPFEIRKTISLAALDPLALLNLIATGEAFFDLPERLFDADFPGHYRRRIKTLSVTLPALVGPYQNVRATLTQTANRLVLEPNLKAVEYLLGEDVTVPAGVLEQNLRAGQRIALSIGQNDSGLFDADPNDPLYLPFEQTGAISSWKLSMPPADNPIDFSSISDVIIDLKYTASDGGDAFRQQVSRLPRVRERNWTSLVRAARRYPVPWHAFLDGPVIGERQTLLLVVDGLRLPHLEQAAVTAFFVRLAVPPGTQTSSPKPYLGIGLAGEEPRQFIPDRNHSVFQTLERPSALGDKPLRVAVSFDLRPGFTPAALRTEDGKRLGQRVLEDIDLVFYLSGRTS